MHIVLEKWHFYVCATTFSFCYAFFFVLIEERYDDGERAFNIFLRRKNQRSIMSCLAKMRRWLNLKFEKVIKLIEELTDILLGCCLTYIIANNNSNVLFTYKTCKKKRSPFSVLNCITQGFILFKYYSFCL